MRDKIAAGTTSYSAPIYVTNSSTGAGLGSLVYNSSGLAAGYRRQGQSTWTSISLSAGTLGTWSSGGWIADNPNVAGSYEVGIPNAALATGVAWVEIQFWGATSMNPVLLYIELDAVNYQSANDFITGVNSIAPPTNWNAMAITSGGLVSANVTQINAVSTSSVTAVNANIGTTQPTNFTGTGGSALVQSDMRDIAGSAVSTGTAQLGVNVVNVAGTASAGAAGYVGVDWSAIHGPTSAVNLSGTTISTSQVVASVSGSVGSVTGAVGSVTGNVGGNVAGSVASVTGNVGGNVAGSVGSISGVTFPSNFGTQKIDTNGYVYLSGPFKFNAAAGFSFAMVQSSDHATPFTAGGVSGVRSIAGGSESAVSGSVSQIGTTNRYYFSGAAADFDGATIEFTFSANGADNVTVSVNTQP